MQKTFGIGDTAILTGISIKKLRYYEEMGLITEPLRVICGQKAYRRYDEEQIQFLKTLKGYLDKGYKLRTAFALAEKKNHGGV